MEQVKNLVNQVSQMNHDELTLLLSKSIGYSIVILGSFVRLPQALCIFLTKSSTGLSFLGCTLELLGMAFNLSYSYANKFPFSSYGEVVFLLIETVAIDFMILKFSNDKKCRSRAVPFLICFLLFLGFLLSGVISPKNLWYFQALTIPTSISGKLAQAAINYQNGHTGQLSVITCVLLTLGCLARIFTSVRETGDKLTAIVYIVSALANAIIVFQIIIYWPTTAEHLKKDAKKKKI